MFSLRRAAAFNFPAALLTAGFEARPDAEIIVKVGCTEVGLVLPPGFCKLDKKIQTTPG